MALEILEDVCLGMADMSMSGGLCLVANLTRVIVFTGKPSSNFLEVLVVSTSLADKSDPSCRMFMN